MYLVKGKNAPLYSLIFRILGLFCGITAITLQLFTNKLIGKGFMANHVLAYFTLQTNIFTAIIFLILVIKTIVISIKNHKLTLVSFYPSLHLACTFFITITMTIYWTVLAPMLGVGDNPLTICNTLFLHLFTPLFAIIDCILFFKHGSVKKIDCLKWLSYPVLYIISLIIIANVSDVPYYQFPMNGETIPLRYPYPFLDPAVVHIWGMVLVIIALIAIVLGFGFFYIFIDNKIAKKLELNESKNSVENI